jgi:hypothetical protein
VKGVGQDGEGYCGVYVKASSVQGVNGITGTISVYSYPGSDPREDGSDSTNARSSASIL